MRDPPLVTDPPGRPGPVRSINFTVVNFARLETSGIDWAASYDFDTAWGRFSPSVAATWIHKYRALDFPGLPSEERTGIAFANGTIPKWKGVATLAWAKRGVGLAVTGRYTNGYADTTPLNGFSIRTGRMIPSQTVFDLQASVNFAALMSSQSWFVRGLKISAGASNLFDKEPPFIDGVSSSGYDPYQADLIGRRLYVTLSKGF